MFGGQPVEEAVRAPGGIGANHDFAPGPVSLGELFDGVLDDLDVVGRSVGTGVAGP